MAASSIRRARCAQMQDLPNRAITKTEVRGIRRAHEREPCPCDAMAPGRRAPCGGARTRGRVLQNARLMRLRHIEVIFAVSRAGSISGAAKALSITQPAASKLLKSAEQQLRFPLFRRLRGRIHPTEEAAALLADIERVFADLERAQDTVRILRERLDARLRIVCLPSLGFGVLPLAAQCFHTRFPRTPVEIAARHTPELVQGLMAREFDLGLCFGTVEPSHAGMEIESRLVTTGNMVYIDHPRSARARRGGPVRLDDIDFDRLIGLTASHHLGRMLHEALERAGMTRAPGIQVQTYYFARALVAAGVGCAVVDEFTAHAFAGDVVVRPIEPTVPFGVYAYSSARRTLAPRATDFLQCVYEACERVRASAPPRAELNASPPAPRPRTPRSGRGASPPG